MSKPDIRALCEMDLEQAPSPTVREEFRVIIGQEAFDRLVEHGHEDTSVEVGGVLVGRALQDDSGAYVVVDDIIDALHSRQEVTELTFTHEAWEHINKEMDAHHEDRKIVGWYHTHPGFGLFLSEQDQFIHRSFFDLPFQIALVYDPLSREHGCFAWRDGEPWRMRRYWVGEEPHLWDGERPSGSPPQKEKKRSKKEDGGRKRDKDDSQRDRDEERSLTPPRGDDEEGTPGFVFTIIVALLALAMGGAGGYFYSARRMADHERTIQQSLALAKAEGAVDAVRLMRSDLLSAVQDSLNREKMWRPMALIRAQLANTLIKITPEVPRVDGKSAKPALPAVQSTEALRTNLDTARLGLKSAVEGLGKLQLDRMKVRALVSGLQQESVFSARELVGLSKETTRLRAGLGQLYSELATMAAARGDARAAQRLLTAAAAFNPAGRDRYKKALQKQAPATGKEQPKPAPAPKTKKR